MYYEPTLLSNYTVPRNNLAPHLLKRLDKTASELEHGFVIVST